MSASITVSEPCTCGRRWFECACSEDIATYEAAGHPWEVEDIGAPTPAFVRYVRDLHPGKSLRYIDLPHLDYR